MKLSKRQIAKRKNKELFLQTMKSEKEQILRSMTNWQTHKWMKFVACIDNMQGVATDPYDLNLLKNFAGISKHV